MGKPLVNLKGEEGTILNKFFREIDQSVASCLTIGKSYKTNPEIDRPIRGYIKRINKCGVITVASCAGHKSHECFNKPYVEIIVNKKIIHAVDELGKYKKIEMTVGYHGVWNQRKKQFEKVEPMLHITYSGNDGLIRARKILFEKVISALQIKRRHSKAKSLLSEKIKTKIIKGAAMLAFITAMLLIIISRL